MKEIYKFKNMFDDKNYTIGWDNDLFCVQCDDIPIGKPCKFWVKVKPDKEFTYKIQKTQIKAKGGAAGLFEFFKWCYREEILESAANIIIKNIISGNVKSAF